MSAAKRQDRKPREPHPSATSEKSKATLFLRNLSYSTTKEDLESHFSQIGPIKNCFIVTANSTSKGIAFVQFSLAEDCVKAIAELGSKKIGGRLVKMELANKRTAMGKDGDEHAAISHPKKVYTDEQVESKKLRDEAEAKYAVTDALPSKQEKTTVEAPQSESRPQKRKPKLILRNLPFNTTILDISTQFTAHGKIATITLPLNAKGKQSGFGFVEFEKLKDAEKALEVGNGCLIGGRACAVDWALPKDLFDGNDRTAQERLDAKTLETKKDAKVEKKRVVEEVAVKAKKQKIEETSDDDEDDFMMADVDVDSTDDESTTDLSSSIKSKFTKPEVKEVIKHQEKSENPYAVTIEEQTTLFIRNLSFETHEDDLYEKFEAFGKLRYAKITVDQVTGHSKGTGFVSFVSKKDTQACFAEYTTAYKLSGTSHSDIAQKRKFSTGKSTLVTEPSLTAQTAPFILDGRFLNITLAVSKQSAATLLTSNKVEKQAQDKRNIYLIKEGVIFPDTPAAKDITPSELSKRQTSYSERKRLLASNPNLFVSKTRLSVRNLPIKVAEPALNIAAYNAVMDFWKDVAAGTRSALDADILQDDVDLKLARPSATRRIVMKQIIRDKDRLEQETGKPRSKGYGFIEFQSHADALACLRVMNNNPLAFPLSTDPLIPSKTRPIVEFSVENTQIVKERDEMKRKALEKKRFDEKNQKIIEKGKARRAEEAEAEEVRRHNGQGKPRVKVVQEDYYKNKSAPTGEKEKQSAAVKSESKKRSGEAIDKKQKKPKVIATPAPAYIPAPVIVKPVEKTPQQLTGLSKNQKRELQKEEKFTNLVDKYKKDLFKDVSLAGVQEEAQRWFC